MRVDLTLEIIRAAVIDKDNEAINEIVRTLTPIIQTNVARVLYRRQAGAQGRVVRQEVEDLTQDVFVMLLADNGRRLLAWDPSCGSVSVFFGLIAQRCVHNILSSRKQSPWTEDPAEVNELDTKITHKDDMERQISSRDTLRAIGKRLVKGLNERDLKLFDLMYVQQLDDQVVREAVGISRDALYQARRRLIKRAQELAGDLFSDLNSPSRVGQ